MSVPILFAGSRYKPGKLVPIPTPPAPVAPHFSSAEVGNVNASTVAVTFDTNIVADGSNYSAGVTIKVNGSTRSFESGIRQANHAVVNYALASPVQAGDTVTWEYSAAAGSIVSESDGTALADVTAQTVTNNVGGGPTPPDVASATRLFTVRSNQLSLNNNDPVSVALDESTYSHNVSSSGTKRPSFQSNIEGKASIYFDPVSDSQYLEDSDFADNLPAFAVFAVAKFDDAINYDTEVVTKLNDPYTDSGWAFDLYFQAAYDTHPDRITAGLNLQNTPVGEAWQAQKIAVAANHLSVISAEWFGSDVGHCYIDGDNSGESVTGTIPSGFSNTQPVRLGTSGALIDPMAGGSFSGWISAVLIYQINDVTAWQTNNDRAAIEAWLAANT